MENGIEQIDINKEMQSSYLQYSMSVIVGRALPDVRDGIKPVHRRVLYAMHALSNTYDKPYKKSARIVGDVIGKYHPHGDQAVYDTIVRMAQSFSLRYPLVDGQGNFGSVDGDAPAAQRYTEVRMTKLAQELLEDIAKDTVDWGPNYDDSLQIPLVLPAKIPHLLVNGSSGIAVGMATNIPPHNLAEVVDACLLLIDTPEAGLRELMECIKGPDFPTKAVVSNVAGIAEAYKTGRGSVTLRAVASVEEVRKRQCIVVTEIPYQVNKAKLIESIVSLVRDKKIEGISDILDESSREGMRIVVQVKKAFEPELVLKKLFKYTKMQTSFGVIMLALDDKNQPRLWNLKAMLEAFLLHRKNVVVRRCIFDLKKATQQLHLLEGMHKAVDHIDRVVQIIKASKDTAAAKQDLMQEFQFSEPQVQAILEMRLQRLTGLERSKIETRIKELKIRIEFLRKVLGDETEVYKIIKTELKELRENYGSPRLSKIEADINEIDDEELIQKKSVLVSITNQGRIKRLDSNTYKLQQRGGFGVKGVASEYSADEIVERLFSTHTLADILCISNLGKMHKLKVYKIFETSRTSKGRFITNYLQAQPDEEFRAFLPIESFDQADKNIVFVTRDGMFKKTALSLFANVRSSGINAINLKEGDSVAGVFLCGAKDIILMLTKRGKALCFSQSLVRPMGRSAAGVKSITVEPNTGDGVAEDAVVGAMVFEPGSKESVLVVTEKGYGKRTLVEQFPLKKGRRGLGVIAQKLNDKTGDLVSARLVQDQSEIIVATNSGQSIRIKASGISVLGRNSSGVRLIKLKPGEFVTSVAVVKDVELSST